MHILPGSLTTLECLFNKTTHHHLNECDKTEAHHTLCFDRSNDEVVTSQVSTWVLLDRGAGDRSGS